MIVTLHNGPKLLLTIDRQTLTLDTKRDGVLTDAEVRKIDRLMDSAGDGCYYAEASKRHQVEALVKAIESPRPTKDPMEPWTSKTEADRARQQRMGGR